VCVGGQCVGGVLCLLSRAEQRIDRWLILTALWLNYNIKTWTGLSVEESVRMTEERDKWRKYVHGVANPRIDDDYRTEQKFTAHESLSCVYKFVSSRRQVHTCNCVRNINKPITSHKSKYAASIRVALSLLCNSVKPGIISHSPATT